MSEQKITPDATEPEAETSIVVANEPAPTDVKKTAKIVEVQENETDGSEDEDEDGDYIEQDESE